MKGWRGSMKKCIMLVFILTVGMFSLVGCGDKTAKSNVSDADGAYFSNNEEKNNLLKLLQLLVRRLVSLIIIKK